jgi:nicotinamide-nucleotide amidase
MCPRSKLALRGDELKAEVISIGDELTSGNRLDTNSQWISQRLGTIGIQTAFHSTVGDCLEDNINVFQNAALRSDIVIATGGLGPTADDLTREVIATAFDAPLELRGDALAHIESLFSRRKRPMPERNRVQAMFPLGSNIIDNPHGTAPGIDFVARSRDHRTCRIFALPGVPAEMKQMYDLSVEPALIRDHGAGVQRWFYHSIKVFGIGESDVEKMLPDLIARDRNPVVGITVSKATITLRIAALCKDQAEFQEKIRETSEQIHSELGLLVFGEGEMDLDEAVAKLLIQQQRRVGVIEVGAGVWIAPALSKHTVDPSCEYGLAAAKWLPRLHDAPDADGAGPNCEASLKKLAESMLHDEDLDLCLAVGVYPNKLLVESSQSLPSSDFHMVLARKDRSTRATQITLAAHPEVLYHRLAKTGMNFLRTELLQRD